MTGLLARLDSFAAAHAAWLPLLIAVSGWVVTVLIAVTGWLVSHGMTLRAQRLHFINGVRNDARKDVVRTIRAQQDWLGKVGLELLTVPYVTPGLSKDPESVWKTKADAIAAALGAEPRETILISLEEYETLFPETRICRGEVQKVIGRYWMDATNVASDLRDPTKREAAKGRVKPLITERSDEWISLLEDLRVHIQNQALGRITRHRVVQRRPARFEGMPRLELGKDGQLRVTRSGELRAASDPTRDERPSLAPSGV
jgi:hypothetical protein